ncbi:MAG: 6-pyruvoyl-tetrahydropterin synthase-related protein, partial [Candidatus Promineifilaceae bacterium]
MSREIGTNFRKGWPIGIAILIGLFAGLPLLRGIPDGADTLLHFYRTVQLDQLLDEGILFSSWAPDFAYGFGYPIFNYYAPFSYYLASSFTLLGMDLIVAFQAVFVLALILASLSTFLWVRDLFGDSAALVAAAMYALSPYLLVDAVNRGALAELLALSILPIILWAVRRYIASGVWSYGLAGLMGYAALALTHNITALVFSPILIGYVLVVSYTSYKRDDVARDIERTRLVTMFWLILLGLALSAFFWMPAVLERNLVQIEQTIGPSDFNYENNFLSADELFAFPFSTDLNRINRDVPIALSLVALFLGTIGLASFWRYREQPEKMGHILYAGLVCIVSLFMTLSLSTRVWEVIPLLQFLQFPWRFLGLASLFLAFLTGAGTDSLLQLAGRRINAKVIIPAVLVGAAALYILPWQFTNYNKPPPDDSVAALVEYERDSGYLGTTSTGEYLPVGVQKLPTDVIYDPANGDVKLQLGSLPPGARVETVEYSPLTYDLIIETPAEFLAVFNTFFFEGWQARIDGEPVPIMATESTGLIGVEVPAGRHELLIYFGTTPTRLFAAVISLTALFLIGATVFLIRRHIAVSDPVDTSRDRHATRKALALITVAVLVVALFKLLYLDRGGNALIQTRFDGYTIDDVDATVSANFEDQMVLMGVDLPDAAISGETIDVTLYWRVGDDVERDYSVSAVVVDGNGIALAQSDRQHPGVQPTSRWSLTDYAADRHQIALPPGTPPGEYQLQVIVYEYGFPENRLNLLDSSGMPAGQTADIITLSVTRPNKPPVLGDIENIHVSEKHLGDDISLVGYSLPEYVARSGDVIYPVFYWRADVKPTVDLEVSMGLLGEKGQRTELLKTRPVEDYPTFDWERDDIWRAVHPLLLPPTLDSGAYYITVGLVGEGQISLGTVDIESPEHTFERPSATHQLEVMFGEVATLVGYNIETTVYPGEQLEAILVWQVSGETHASYKTFVQLLDQEGRFVSGSDMVPGNWQRPTTGWIEGEYIIDEHVLAIPADLPPGDYLLLIGLYDAENLQR